jgi:hypothetical protein
MRALRSERASAPADPAGRLDRQEDPITDLPQLLERGNACVQLLHLGVLANRGQPLPRPEILSVGGYRRHFLFQESGIPEPVVDKDPSSVTI